MLLYKRVPLKKWTLLGRMSADLLKKAQGQWEITTPRRSSVTICLSKLLSHQSVSPLSNTFVARQLLILCSAFTVLKLHNGVNLNNKEGQLTNEPHIHFPRIIAAQANMWYHSFIRLFSTINASESWSVLLFLKKDRLSPLKNMRNQTKLFQQKIGVILQSLKPN